MFILCAEAVIDEEMGIQLQTCRAQCVRLSEFDYMNTRRRDED